MEMHRTGRTVAFSGGISVLSWGSIGGKLEGQGPLGSYFDEIETDSFCGQASWEKAESIFQQRALGHALERGGMGPEDVDLVLAGDLLNQCAASNFALRNQPFSVAGLYAACATMGEGLALAAMLLQGGAAHVAAAVTSSHYCTAERQYRMPLPYGSQRCPTAQWTATASGCISPTPPWVGWWTWASTTSATWAGPWPRRPSTRWRPCSGIPAPRPRTMT